MEIIKHFLIYGCVGILLESFWTGLESAFIRGDKNLTCSTYLWMFPIYGLGVILEPVHEVIRGLLFIYRGFIWAFLIFLIEYITGFILKRALGKCPWNYEKTAQDALVSVNGFVRVDFLPVWFCAGLIFEKIHDIVKLFI